MENMYEELKDLYEFAQAHKDCFTLYNGMDVQVYQYGQQINFLDKDMLAVKAYTFEKFNDDVVVVHKYYCMCPGVIDYDRGIEIGLNLKANSCN